MAKRTIETSEQTQTTENFTERTELEDIINAQQYASERFIAQISSVFGNLEKMTPEQKTKMQEITNERTETIKDLKKILGEIGKAKYAGIIKAQELDVYSRSSEKIEEKTTEEYRELQDKIDDLQKRSLELDEKQEILLKEFRLRAEGKKLNRSLDAKMLEEMRTISVTDFLKKPFDDRLQFVTSDNIHAADLRSSKVTDIEINFSFDGRFNRALYMATTAGMIIPDEIRTVQVDGVSYSRSDLSQRGEFFDAAGRRLTIHDGTKIHADKKLTTEELEKKYASKLNLAEYKTDLEKTIALESEKRGIPPHLFLDIFKNELEQVSDIATQKAILEDLFVEIDRKKWSFTEDYLMSPIDKEGKMTARFLGYLLGGDADKYREVAKKNGYSEADIAEATGYMDRGQAYHGNLNPEQFAGIGVAPADVARIRSMKKFEPGSKDTVMLFKLGAKAAGISEAWATNQNLHAILGKESNGKVGVLNYTIKGMSLDTFIRKANSSTGSNPIGAKSTASGLGQLLLSNVDKHYPSGRRGIGDPIEEAAGFMNYIKERYGDPDVAWSVYGRTGSYVHAVTGKKMHKWFQEGY